MQNVFKETRLLEKRAIDKFLLTEEILLENASLGLKNIITALTHPKSLIYIICGGGNNGADGLALARKLDGDYNVRVYMASEPKSPMCEREFFRCKSVGIHFVNKLYSSDVVVDCLYGSGFRGEISPLNLELLTTMNKMARLNIACDLPSGIMQRNAKIAFRADHTIAMGALKVDLLSEWAKDFIGKLWVVDLGVSRKHYELSSKMKLLDKTDLSLPHRKKLDTHKGEYGHLAILCKKSPLSKGGASVMSALSAIAFGAGKVSLVGEVENLPFSVMNLKEIPSDATALAFGMGAGEITEDDLSLCKTLPCVLDADVFAYSGLKQHLNEMQHTILTPHIKEFASLLRVCGIADLGIDELKMDRLSWVEEFCSLYPHITLVLKGANTIIARGSEIYFSSFGGANLAKAGSGDVLSGMIASLLAQGYDPLRASISGVLAHALASEKIQTSYGLNPTDLIEAIKFL